MIMRYVFHPKLFNPLYYIMRTILANDDIRFIFTYGGSSAAKTYSICQSLEMEAIEYTASTMVLRKFGVDIDDSVYADFKDIGEVLKTSDLKVPIKRLIRYKSGAIVRFRGLDESEKLKGLKGFKYLYYNELSLFAKADFDQGKKRLRGMPGQKIIADWNPIIQTHWIKTEVLDKEEWIDYQPEVEANTAYTSLNPDNSFIKINKSGDMILIKTHYPDNHWVVGHPSGKDGGGRFGFVDKHVLNDFERDRIHNPNDYKIYALGEWGQVRTGSEFWKNFDESKHVKPLAPYVTGTIHVSVDSNVQPYITLSIWQINTVDKVIQQIHELPCESPNNSSTKAANAFCDWLDKIGYSSIVFLYGDPSGNAKNTIDPDNKSFFQKFKEEIIARGYMVKDRVQRSAPEVAMSGEFVNDIYGASQYGWRIEINTSCRKSIDDYVNVKEDKDGKMLKKRINDKERGISYEQYGHFSDTKRYFITTVLEEEFKQFINRKAQRVGIKIVN